MEPTAVRAIAERLLYDNEHQAVPTITRTDLSTVIGALLLYASAIDAAKTCREAIRLRQELPEAPTRQDVLGVESYEKMAVQVADAVLEKAYPKLTFNSATLADVARVGGKVEGRT